MYKLEMDKIDFIVVDTLEFSKNYIKDNDNKKLKSYSLENLKELFNLDVYQSHDALDDSYACVAIFEICKSNSIEKVKNLIPKLEYLQKLKGRHTKSITKLIYAINNLVVLKSSKI
jgi:DNA polymerase III epsilon subunit-like protein